MNAQAFTDTELADVTPCGYTSQQVQAYLGIKDRQLLRYCNLLRESCPDEFSHPKGSGFYSIESYQALKKVRKMFRTGATTKQVREKLRVEGF